MNRISLIELNKDKQITFMERPNVTFTFTREIGRGASCIVYHAVSSDNTEHLLKEYYPKHLDLTRDSSGQIVVPADKADAYAQGLVRFYNSCERQKTIRLSNEGLKNFTCNVQGYYRANGTEYIDMTCFNGQIYDKVQEKSVYNLMLRMRTLAQVVDNYHKAGLLHLDIKPENIYVRPEGETIEDVMLFDFDSVTSVDKLLTEKALSCTKTWAAPEQLLPEKRRSICPATDLFAIGEIIFVQLFGRHSTSAERRSFVTGYPCDHKTEIFKDMNPKVFPLLDDLLCHTICGVVGKRYKSAEELVATLDEIIKIADPKTPYLKSSPLAVQDFFVGREGEIQEIHRLLNENRILFLNGIGGIGKSELAKRYALKYKADYDAIIFAPYVSDVNMLLLDDNSIPLYNFAPYPEEKPEEYCARKLKKLRELCDERTLFIVDNLDREDDPNLNKLLDLGCKFLVTTRRDFSGFGKAQLYVDKLESTEKIREIFEKYYKAQNEEESACVDEIIAMLEGHTMAVELVAKQIDAEWATADEILLKLKESGVSGIGDSAVDSGKDGLNSRSTFAHIKALFDFTIFTKNKNENALYVLSNLALIPHTGIDRSLFANWCELSQHGGKTVVNNLIKAGWVRQDKATKTISLHPLVLDILQDIIDTEDVKIFLARFTETLTDDDTGEIILQACPFAFANTVASVVLGLFQRQQLMPTEEAIHCIGKMGDFFFEQGLYDLAERSYCAQQEFYKTLNLTDAYLALVIYNNLALLYDKQGELVGKRELSEKALCYHKKCLLIAEEPQNNMTEYVSRVYGNIGSVYHTLKDYVNAENYYKKALEHSDRYNFCNNLGVLYDNQGRYVKALEMHQEAMKRAIEHDEPELVIALIEHNMAVNYKRLGMLDDATTHCENALRSRKKLLNSEVSYDLALSKSLLGQIYIENCVEALLPEAERLLTEALTSLGKIVGSSHEEYKKVRGVLSSFSKKD